MYIRFLFLFLAVLFLHCDFQNTVEKTQNPNILILLADDMGYGDLGCYGGKALTPNLDSLAAAGIRLTNCYSGAPNCSPARVSLMTGRIPARSGMYSYRPPNHVMHLPDGEITIAEHLKKVGYQTAHFGKWHLGALPQDSTLNHPQPIDQGFEYSLGTQNNAQPSHLNPNNFIRNGVPVGKTQGYACQLLADEVDLWLNNYYTEEKPFFMYVAFHEPHAKIASPPEMISHYPDEKAKDAAYFANIENMDNATGRILKMLRERKLDDNTLIFFTSDNGSYRMGSNGDLRGLKGEVYDGGIKEAGIFYFSNEFMGARVINTPVWFQDIFPTISSLVETKIPEDRHYDGIDLLPLLKENKPLERQQPMLWFFYRSSPEISMRDGNFSLIARVNDTVPRTHWLADRDMPFIKSLGPDYFELYDLTKDKSQKYDLSNTQLEKLAELKEKFYPLFESVIEEGPFWEGLPAYDREKANHNKPKEFERNQRRFLEAETLNSSSQGN